MLDSQEAGGENGRHWTSSLAGRNQVVAAGVERVAASNAARMPIHVPRTNPKRSIAW